MTKKMPRMLEDIEGRDLCAERYLDTNGKLESPRPWRLPLSWPVGGYPDRDGTTVPFRMLADQTLEERTRGLMPLTEHTINDALAEVLRPTRQAWRESNVVTSETTGMLKGGAKRPDILVIEPNVSPVVIETEVLPAVTVEAEACSRLGAHLSATGQPILSAIAVRLPARLRTSRPQDLRSDIASAKDLEIALYTGSSASGASRFPEIGWLRGSVADLSLITQAAGVPPEVIEDAANQLVEGVTESAALLAQVANASPGALQKISEELRQKPSEQTQRMATTILANAFVFHETLANGPGPLAQVATLDQLRGRPEGLTKSAVLAEWRTILKANYWPIFNIARRILEVIPPAASNAIIERLATTATKLLEHRLMRSHDLTGRVFQRLIVDRKFLAAYYTTPASAALLIGLAIGPQRTPLGGSWADADEIKSLKIADFACGTGTLLSTAYAHVGQLHELAGGDAEAIHPEMMAHALVGCDILPAAAHLTASMLAGAHPTVRYVESSVLTVPYGRQPDKAIALGSLDLLKDQAVLDILDLTASSAGAMGEKETKVWSKLPHASFDVVVMNPPFTRPTGHEAKKVGVPVPMFAAFGIDAKTQRAMSQAAEKLTAGSSAHGNAGEASIFLVIAERKLKAGGTLALVLPLSLVSGDAWEASRALLRKNYADLIVVSIAATHDADLSFSADTGMGECLVIATRTAGGTQRGTFVSLRARPTSTLAGASLATEIERLRRSGDIQTLEGGPVGGTPLFVGSDILGSVIDGPLPSTGPWNLARIADLSLAQTAYQLAEHGCLWLPSCSKKQTVSVPISTIGKIGSIGPYHMDIMGATSTGGIRGPFAVLKVTGSGAPTYPVLWSHDAPRERTLAFEAESEGLPLKGANATERDMVLRKVAEVWDTASHCHFNRDLRFNSQSTAVQFSPRKSIGGRAWPSVQLKSEDQEKALVLWGNTTLGLLLYWWHANRQQAGRGSIGKAALAGLPALDVTAFSKTQLKHAAKLFDAVAQRPLRPVNEMDTDPARAALDERFMTDVLSLDPVLVDAVALLRAKLAREPSIQGSKQLSDATDANEDAADD
jgi:hypothetical protein